MSITENIRKLVDKNVPAELLVLMPTRGNISTETLVSLEGNMDGVQWKLIQEVGLPVDEARNALAERALSESISDDQLCLWVDDDCYWCAGTVALMLKAFESLTSIDVLTAYFSPRAPFSTPLCALRPSERGSAPREGRDFQVGQIIQIASASMNFVLHRVSLLRDVGPNPFTPLAGSLGEDHSFFERLRLLGRRASLATGIFVAHCEHGLAFIPGRRPFRVVDNRLQPACDGQSDEEIAAQWAGRNLQRSYGANVDILCPESSIQSGQRSPEVPRV